MEKEGNVFRLRWATHTRKEKKKKGMENKKKQNKTKKNAHCLDEG